MKLEILKLLVQLAILVVSGILVPAFKKWLDEKTENEKLQKVKQWAETACYAAEQIYKKAKKNDPDGTLRKNYAYKLLMRICTRYGVDLTEGEADALIEAAVNAINFGDGLTVEECIGFPAENGEEDD